MSESTRTAFVALSAVFLGSLCLPPPGRDGAIAHLPAFCPFYALTGLPCPGCGLTRAFVCLSHGQFAASLHWHPLGWLVYGVCLASWLRAGLSWALQRPVWVIKPRTIRCLSGTALALLLLTGIVRIGWLLAHHQRFT